MNEKEDEIIFTVQEPESETQLYEDFVQLVCENGIYFLNISHYRIGPYFSELEAFESLARCYCKISLEKFTVMSEIEKIITRYQT